jgi:predicted HicB family RNase H-like nuclease
MKKVLLRNMSEQLHREAKSTAALMGISLNEFILRAIVDYLRRIKGKGVK